MSRRVVLRRRAPWAVYVLRFLVGHHLDGRRRSDATFWRPGTQGEPSFWGMGGESRWAMLAGWERAVVRLGTLAALVGLWRWREVTEWVLGCVLGPAAGLSGFRIARAVRTWRHRRTVEEPLAAALAPFLGMSPSLVERSLRVRPGWAEVPGGEHIASLTLPDEWAATPDQKTRVEQVIGARLGVEVRWAWRTSQHPMVLNVTRAPRPPERVPFAEVLDVIEACELGKMLLGVAADGSYRYWDTSSEDPHVAVHGGSRRGKTTWLLVTSGQVIRQWDRLPLPDDAPECCAGRVTAIDPKRVSLMALAGVPGVELRNDPRDIEGMWDGVRRFAELVDARYEVLAADPTAEFRRSLLILDEVSQLSGMWAQHWRHVKEKSDPALPPVWDDVAACVWMGAQCNAHVIVAGQRLDYQILGGMLGSFGVRMLAGYGPQDYARLVGLPPYQRSQKPRGRFLLYAGGELDWLQLVFAEPDEVRSWLLGDRESGSDLAGDGSHVSIADSALIGLREAVEARVIRCTLDAARRARADDSRFPAHRDSRGQERLYLAGELRAWDAARPRAGRFEVSQ